MHCNTRRQQSEGVDGPEHGSEHSVGGLRARPCELVTQLDADRRRAHLQDSSGDSLICEMPGNLFTAILSHGRMDLWAL